LQVLGLVWCIRMRYDSSSVDEEEEHEEDGTESSNVEEFSDDDMSIVRKRVYVC